MASRRDFLKGTMSLAAIIAAGGCQRRLVKPPNCAHFTEPHASFVADAHCHIFNASDLQVSGFINHTVFKVPNTNPISAIGDLVQEFGWNLAPSADEELEWLRTRGDERGTFPTLAPGQRVLSISGAPPLDATIQNMGANSDERFAAFWREVQRRAPERMAAFTQQTTSLRMQNKRFGSRLQPQQMASDLQSPDGVRRQILLEQQFALDGSFNAVTFLKPFFRFRTENAWSMLQMYGCDSQPGVDMICPALVDFDLWLGDVSVDGGRTHSHIDKQLEVMRELALATHGRVQGLAPFNPLRAACDGGDYLARARKAITESGCIGFKMYPPMGFRPLGNASESVALPHCPAGAAEVSRVKLDQVLGEFFEMCAGESIPVMAHTSESNGAGPDTAKMADPAFWSDLLGGHAESFLARKSSLRINLGHMGGDHYVDQPSEWRQQIATMMNTFPDRVYADLSYYEHMLGNESTRGALADQMRMISDEGVWQHVMYGSDWDMLGSVPGAQHYLSAFNSFLIEELHLNARQVAAILGENAKAFFAFAPGGAGLERLKKFHGSQVRLPFEASLSASS